MLAYRFLQRLLRLGLRIFFRRIEVVGLQHVPGPNGGPVIFCGNHPNSLLDPILITVFCGRIVHFAAKDVLFKSRLLRFFLSIMGAVPVQRRKDHPDGPLDNESAFDALYEVLAQGRCMGIFPEGISHNRSQLAALKTGAARIAFGAEERHPGTRVKVIPCGLTYIHRHRFRSSVLVQFGPAIEISEDDRQAYENDSRAAVRTVTAEIEAGLRALTVNAEDWETLRVLDGVRRLYQPPKISLQERVELARRFNTVYPQVKDKPEVVELFIRVRSYLDRLSAAGLTDGQIRKGLSQLEIAQRTVGHLIWTLIWLPLGLIGAILHLPFAILLGWASERWAPRKDVVGTTKFLAGFLLIQAIYLMLFIYAALTFGWMWGLGLLVFVPFSGYATLRVVERYAAVRHLFLTSVRMLALKREITALRHQRQLLEVAVVDAVERLRPADMKPLFPREDELEDLL